MRHSFRQRVRAFTLVELLAVVAIISLLAAILIPSAGAVRRSTNKAKTRVLFSQWASAIEAFRSEYGYYPVFDGSGLVNPSGQSSAGSSVHLFHDVLAGKRRDGSPLPAGNAGAGSALPPEVQNRKRIAFHVFAESEFSAANLLQDGAGNTDIAVLVDRNLDGQIDGGDWPGPLPLVGGLRPSADDFPSGGVRAGVLFYAPAEGATPAAPGFVFSWK